MAMTQNFTWLKRPQPNNLPIDMAVNIAKFWESRPTFNETKGKWEINGMYKSMSAVCFFFNLKFMQYFSQQILCLRMNIKVILVILFTQI